MLVGIASWFLVTDSINSARWLTTEEKGTLWLAANKGGNAG